MLLYINEIFVNLFSTYSYLKFRCITDFCILTLKLITLLKYSFYQFSSVAQSCLTFCDPMDRSTPLFSVHHHSWSLLKLISFESVISYNHLILCHPLLLSSIFPSIRVFSASQFFSFSSVQLSSVPQSCPTLCDPMNHSTPGLHVHHQLPEFTQTLVHRVGDAIQPSHPLSSPSSPTPNPSQHQGLFQRVNSSHEMAKVLQFQLQ